MRILFIENRYSTYIWQVAADALAADGHEIHWLVQNKSFQPNRKNVHLLSYPSGELYAADDFSSNLDSIARTDRALRLFGIRSVHYPHYQAQIKLLIDEISPDLVFGEATQFHELMVIGICKSRNIVYLAPNATRYPVGRLVFWLYDTFESVGGSGEILSAELAEKTLYEITTRSVQPSYMAPPKRGLLINAMRVLEQMRIAYAWLRGERYITPSPLCRFKLGRAHSEAKQAWETVANDRKALSQIASLGLNDRWVLYPLQLQPESNLDVYGQPWINQAETLDRTATSLARRNAYMVVKPNPKSKYEMNREIVSVVKRHSNIIPLPHDIPMGKIFPQSPLVLSVTGTVILECVFVSKPVCVLGNHTLSRLPGVTPITDPEQVSEILEHALIGEAHKSTHGEAIDLLRNLHASSYDALLWDPIARPDLFNFEELKRLRKAFRQIVDFVHSQDNFQRMVK